MISAVSPCNSVTPVSGIISHKFGAEKITILYGFTLIEHQIRAVESSNPGGILIKRGMGYAPLWIVDINLAAIAAAASFAIWNNRLSHLAAK